MPSDDDTDYRKYTRAELEEALGNIGAARYPINYGHLRKELGARADGTSREPSPVDTSETDAAMGFWVELAIAVMVTLYALIGALRGDLLIPLFLGHRQIHLAGVAAWIAATAALVVAMAVALGGLDTTDPPKIRPQFRWVFRLAGINLLLAFCWQQISPSPN
jgi:hypothetical protein